jgi:hypothetical protein
LSIVTYARLYSGFRANSQAPKIPFNLDINLDSDEDPEPEPEPLPDDPEPESNPK